MRTMIRSVLVSVLLGFLTVVAAQRTPSCEEWNTAEYFQTATVEDVTACLDAGADPMARDDIGRTPLHWAALANENPAAIETLLRAGAELEARDDIGHTPLHWAALANENPAAIETLLRAGAELEARDESGHTPLHEAAQYNENSAVIQALIDAGADPKVRDKSGHTPLHEAALANENPAVIKALVAAGAKLEARDEDGDTPLHWAAQYNENSAVIQALIDAGADPKVRDERGRTPLHWAALANKNPAVIKALVAAGAKLEARDEDGDTPLHWAAKYVHWAFPDYVEILGDDDPHAGDAIEALLDAGADPMARNAAGETPWDLAKGNKALKGSDAYWRLNEARFEAPGRGARGSPTTGPTSTSDKSNVELAAAVPSSGPGCMIAGYPSPPGGVANLGFSWCPASVSIQVRSFALQAAGAQCAIATGSSSTPEQISARRQEINAACDGLAALAAPNCQCPPGLRP